MKTTHKTTHKLFKQSSEDMSGVETDSVHLVVTSPPYNQGIDYSEYDDKIPWRDYITSMKKIFKEVYRVLVPGGRVCINVANLDRYNEKRASFYNPLRTLFERICLKIGFLHQGEIIWNKTRAMNITTWGSYRMPTKPMLRDKHEYILVFAKEGKLSIPEEYAEDNKSISKTEFAELTQSIWNFNPAKNSEHPATFPEELVRRCMVLYSYPGKDIIMLDPFGGSGTLAKVAKKYGRSSISFEISKKYQKMIEDITNQTQINEFFDIEKWFTNLDKSEKST